MEPEAADAKVFTDCEKVPTEAGMEMIFTCAGDECGPGYASSAWNRLAHELVDGNGIDAARLSGHGVGPLCPVSTNRSDPGRSKNRRVDLIEQ